MNDCCSACPAYTHLHRRKVLLMEMEKERKAVVSKLLASSGCNLAATLKTLNLLVAYANLGLADAMEVVVACRKIEEVLHVLNTWEKKFNK